MSQADQIVKEFLIRVGAEQTPKAGLAEPRDLTPKEAKELCDRLRAVAAKNAPLAWVLVCGVLGLAIAGFVVTAAVGGTLGLVSGGFTTMFILPVGRFLYRVWQEKFRIEAFLELFPTLPPAEQRKGLTRFLYRDTSE